MLPPPLQVSSQLLFLSPTASSLSSDLLFCLFSLNKEAETQQRIKQCREGEKRNTKRGKERETGWDINKLFCCCTTTTHIFSWGKKIKLKACTFSWLFFLKMLTAGSNCFSKHVIREKKVHKSVKQERKLRSASGRLPLNMSIRN